MRKLTVLAMISLDGILQAPGGTEEDSSNGFKYGGWVAPFGDQIGGDIVQQELSQQTDYLLGRKTFEIWENYWPHHGDFWPRINEGVKYVLSETRSESDWKNSVFLKNIDAIKKLKDSDGADIQVWGSSELVHLLLENDMVDELRLKIHPLLLGKGKKLFHDAAIPTAFTLMENTITTTGVIIAVYKRAGSVKTGNIEV